MMKLQDTRGSDGGRLAHLEANLAAASERVAALEAALKWYAREGNYESIDPDGSGVFTPAVNLDFGERARAALDGQAEREVDGE